MNDGLYGARGKAFKNIYVFLIANGLKKSMRDEEAILYICDRYTQSIAKKILDLSSGVSPYHRDSLYYKQDLAFQIDCEELTQGLWSLDGIFREKGNSILIYRKKFSIRKIFYPILNIFFRGYSQKDTFLTLNKKFMFNSKKNKKTQPLCTEST